MASLSEYFQAFHKYAVENDLSASSRTLYYTILGEFNARFWQSDNLSISVRDMQVLGGFQSSSVVDRAKMVLGTENIVKIQKLKNRRTQYELVEPQSWLRNKTRTLEGQERNTLSTPAEHSQNSGFIKYMLSTAEEKDGKTLRQENNNNNSAGAREYNSQISRELNKAWIENVGENPRGGIYLKLLEAEQKHGTQKVVDAINTAAIHNTEPRLSFGYVLKILENTLTKGAVTNGKVNRTGEKSAQDYDWNKDMPDLSKYEV